MGRKMTRMSITLKQMEGDEQVDDITGRNTLSINATTIDYNNDRKI